VARMALDFKLLRWIGGSNAGLFCLESGSIIDMARAGVAPRRWAARRSPARPRRSFCAAMRRIIMQAKKARGVESSKAVGITFEAFGLDPQNQDHWDILLSALKEARPKKKRGRPQKWTEAEVVKFTLEIRSAEIDLLQLEYFATALEEIRSQCSLPEWIAYLRSLAAEAKMAKKEGLWSCVRAVMIPLVLELERPTLPSDVLLELEYATEERFYSATLIEFVGFLSGKHRPKVYEATMIAGILQRKGLHRHMTRASLTKYLVSGPPGWVARRKKRMAERGHQRIHVTGVGAPGKFVSAFPDSQARAALAPPCPPGPGTSERSATARGSHARETL
jgi:hypothetical protein